MIDPSLTLVWSSRVAEERYLRRLGDRGCAAVVPGLPLRIVRVYTRLLREEVARPAGLNRAVGDVPRVPPRPNVLIVSSPPNTDW